MATATTPTNRAEAPAQEQPQTNLATTEQPKGQILKPQIQVGFGVVLSDFDSAWRMATAISRSDLAPKDYRDKPENAFIAMQMGAEVGLPPMAALQNIAVINGRPSIWGDSALAIVIVHPAFESIEEYFEGTGDNKAGVCKIKRRGHAMHTVRFSVSDAKTAGLWKKAGPWTNYPDRMLQMRPRGFALRDKFPDALRGLSIAEEAMDIPVDTSSRQEDARATVAAELPADIRRASEPAPEPATQQQRTTYNEASTLEEVRSKNTQFTRFKELHEAIYMLNPEVAGTYTMGGSPAEVEKMLVEMGTVAANLKEAAEKAPDKKPEVQGVPLGDLFKK